MRWTRAVPSSWRRYWSGGRAPRKRVRIVEVGPRDGLQNERVITTGDKVRLIEQLAVGAGLRTVEVGSFVSAKRVPQMADTGELWRQLQGVLPSKVLERMQLPVLVPNERHLERALEVGCREVAVFVSASEGFSVANLGCSIAESLQRVERVFQRIAELHELLRPRVRAYVSCVFECPYDGPVKPEAVAQVAQQLLRMGCYEVSLGDTIGVGTPGSVMRLLDTLLEGDAATAHPYAVHFHDTFGTALANIECAIREYGIAVVDSAVGGLGGCPFAPGSSGNVATEDVVYMLRGMNALEEPVDLNALVRIGVWANGLFGRGTRSRVAQAMTSRSAAATQPAAVSH
ncbi:hypothetical protein CDCA_CDCA18G4517 [Cyanidium caldarium]|uniref:hydroxymethylglutaryl-CoA lyase n=1 Tax=Cyanidium caldarium TaxID=2771 RepID=A0AAV9J1Q3_CYACA|nr:hypothetical protein CDCA_CDCA18G4517 [Cyanidium caldarium]